MPATRDRLIDVALQLFAERGFSATTVGDIEEGAGLTRRGRAFYRHFASKDEVLAACLERHLRDVEGMHSVADMMPLGDLRSELTLMCRWILMELANEREVVRILEQEGDQVPELRDRMRRSLVDAAHLQGAEFIRRWTKSSIDTSVDAEAVAAVLIGAVVNYRRTEWTFGAAPVELSEERFVLAWVATGMRLFESATTKTPVRTARAGRSRDR
ncbi:MAG TPA: TetR family transcriptional regulator [Acidimicrobiales bacterium]|nr:TetR family transcriptional regulator [Acidimicrobiales bacterium]